VTGGCDSAAAVLQRIATAILNALVRFISLRAYQFAVALGTAKRGNEQEACATSGQNVHEYSCVALSNLLYPHSRLLPL
jgi:hypothetical protein